MRWEGDELGRGVASAAGHAGGVERLLAAMRAPDWVADDPEAHLLPHIREALARRGMPLHLVGFETAPDGELVVRLRADGAGGIGGIPGPGARRAAVLAVVGSFAETTTFVEERDGGEFVVVTGLLEGRFAPHGHVVRLLIES